MSIYTEINKAWATLFGFKVEDDEATFNDKPLYWNNNAVANWDDLLSAKPSDLKQSAGFTEVPNTKTYDELMTTENFSYGAFDWTNEHGTRLGFSLGKITIFDTTEGGYQFTATTNGIGFWTDGTAGTQNNGLGYAEKIENYMAFYVDQQPKKISLDEIVMPDNQTYYVCGYMHNGETWETYGSHFAFVLEANMEYTTWNTKIYHYNGGNWVLDNNPYIDDDDMLVMYFDDGRQLPEGIEWNEELASYFVPKVKETEITTILTQTTATQAMLGAQIMTHVSLWGMGIGCACFIVGIFKLFARSLSRR